MSLSKGGKITLEVEIQNISKDGIWLIVKNTEYFLPMDEFPWFRNANVNEICHVKLLHDHHLHWPALDVDLELESLENLEKYPLTYH